MIHQKLKAIIDVGKFYTVTGSPGSIIFKYFVLIICLSQKNDFFENAQLVIKHLKALKEDISIAEFIKQFFAEDKYQNLRKSFTSYIEGYYSGKTERSSAKAFLEEWLSEDEQQYKSAGGYGKIIITLLKVAEKKEQ